MGRVLRSLAHSPFVLGFARALDMVGSFNQPNPYRGENPAHADARSMASDWDAIGRDVLIVVEEMAEESNREHANA